MKQHDKSALLLIAGLGLLVALFLAIQIRAEDVVLGTLGVDTLTFTDAGGGNVIIGFGGGASPYWTDPNIRTMWLAFEDTNATQTLDWGDDTPPNNASNMPNVATGPAWVETGTNSQGRISKGYDFDGAGDYFLVNTNADLEQRPITVAFWAKRDTHPSSGSYGFMNVYAKAYDGTRVGMNVYCGSNFPAGTGTNIGWTMAWWEGGWIFNGTGTVGPTGVWEFVSAVDDGTNSYIYTNAVLANTRACTRSANTQPLKIGEYHGPFDGSGYGYFNGQLSDVWIYPKALSASELETLRDNSNPTNDLQARP